MGKATHLLHIAEVDDEGHVTWDATCLNDDEDPRRDCLLVAEASCLWNDWENGDHHPDCPESEWAACEERLLRPSDEWACWKEEPDECEGVDHPELGHAHPTKGCALREWLVAAGFGDNVFFAKRIMRPAYPVGVTLGWGDFEAIELTEAPHE